MWENVYLICISISSVRNDFAALGNAQMTPKSQASTIQQGNKGMREGQTCMARAVGTESVVCMCKVYDVQRMHDMAHVDYTVKFG